MDVVYSRSLKNASIRAVALSTAALLAAALLSAVGLGAAAAQADDSGPVTTTVSVTGDGYGYAEGAVVSAYRVTGTGSDTKYTYDNLASSGDGVNDIDGNGVAPLGSAPITQQGVGVRYVYQVALPDPYQQFTGFSEEPTPGNYFADYASLPFATTTWFGSTVASNPADAGTYTPTADSTINVSLETGYSISGTVSSDDPDSPFQFAEAYHQSDTDPNGPWITETYANGGGDGGYTIPHLRPGVYKLRFTSTGSDAVTYSGGASSLATASTITVTDADVTGQDITMLSPSYSITGTIDKPNGTPVANDESAWATLYEADGTTDIGDSVPGEDPSDSPGGISWTNLAAGSYILQTVTGDNTTAPYGDFYNNQPDASSATLITVGPDNPSATVTATLSSGFTLSGKLTSSTGVPLAGADISAYPANGTLEDSRDFGPAGSVTTDSHGNYTFSALAPGDYYFQVDDEDNFPVAFPDQYVVASGTTLDESQAVAVGFAGGAHTLNISILPVATVDIHLVTSAGKAMTGGTVTLSRIVGGKLDPEYDIQAYQVAKKPGYYEAGSLNPDWTYTAYIDPGGSDNLTPQYLGGSSTADNAKTFTLKPGLNTIDATFVTPGQLTGFVSDATTGKALGGVLVSLFTFDGTGWVPYTSIVDGVVREGTLQDVTESNPDGTYFFGDLEAGSYKVQFGAFPGATPIITDEFTKTQTTVPQFSGGASTLADATPVYVTAKTPGFQDAAMQDGGSLTGVLTNTVNAALIGADVVPYYYGIDGDSPPVADYDHTAVTSKTGVYKVAGLTPGIWKLAYVVNPLATTAFTGYVGGDSLATATAFTVSADQVQSVATVPVPNPATTRGSVVVTFQDSHGNLVDLPWIEADLVPTSGPDYSKCNYNYVTPVICGVPAADGTDLDNVATIPSVTPGGYDLLIKTQSYDGSFQYLPQVIPVTMDASGDEVDQTVTLQDVAPLTFSSGASVDSSAGLAVGDTLTAVDGTVDQPDTSISYQWYRSVPTALDPVVGDLTLIRGAQGSTYTLRSGDFGDDVTVRVTHTAQITGDGQVLYTNSGSTLGSAGPVITATTGLETTVSVNGSSLVGGTLYADAETTGGTANSFTYQWVRTDDATTTIIPEATDASYVVQPADFDAQATVNGLSVIVTALKNGLPDSAPVTSSMIDVGPADPVTVTKSPTVSSKTSKGVTTYTVKPGAYAVAGIVPIYTWVADGVTAQDGGTTFVPTVSEANESIVVFVEAQPAGYTNQTTTLVAHKGTDVPTASDVAVTDDTNVGGAQVGDLLEVNDGSWIFADGTSATSAIRYQWSDVVGTKVTAIKGATSAQYRTTASDLGKTVRVTEFADSTTYATGSELASAGLIGPNESLATAGHVSVRPRVAVGATETPVLSGFPSGAKHTYLWQSEPSGGSTWAPIAKATKSSLVMPVALDAGASVRVIVSSTLTGYDLQPAISDPIVLDTSIRSLTPPTVSPLGAATVGEKLTATTGTVDVASTTATYQWLNDDGLITGATAKTYTAGSGDTGKQVWVVETWAKSGYTSELTTSLKTAVVAVPTSALSTNAPVSLGTLQVGIAVPAPPATVVWSGIPDGFTNYKVTYQWNLAGKAISKATASNYTPISSQIGKALTVTEKFTSTSYTAPTASSAPSTVAIGSSPTFTVTTTANSNNIATGVTLGSIISAPSITGLKYTYQWQTSTDENTWTAIEGATKSAYLVTGDLVGNFVRVEVTSAETGYLPGTQDGLDYVVHSTGDIHSIGTATLSATPTVGVPLAATGVWDVTKGLTFSYQWILDGVDIPGATSATFIPTANQLTQSLSVEITANEPGYTSASATTNELAVVRGAAPTMSTTASKKAVITGTATSCSLLSSSAGLWSLQGLTVGYQWYRGSIAIEDAVGASYQPVVADNGSALHVVLTATSPGYHDGSYTTAATAKIAKCS